MVQVNGEDVFESVTSCCVDGVAGVVRVCPRVGSVCQAPVGQQVKKLLVRVVLTEPKKVWSIPHCVFFYATDMLF